MYRCTAVWSGLPGLPAFTTMHFDDDGGRSATDALATFVAFMEDLAAQVVSSVTCTPNPEVLTVTAANGEITGATQGTTAPIIGGQPGNPVASATQGLVRLTSDTYRNGRRVLGRVFVPALSDATIDTDGTPTATCLLSFANAATELIDDLATVQPVIWARPQNLGGDPPTAILGAAVPVTGFAAPNQFAVLRSRRD